MFVAENGYCLTDKLKYMKKVAVFMGLMVLLACTDTEIKKPEKLIDETVMSAIIYDLAVMDGMKSRNQLLSKNISSEYIYKKYNIDSLQFAQNSRYYSADINKYKKIYETVSERLIQEKKVADSLVKVRGQKPATPAVPNDDSPRIEYCAAINLI
jgi:hypothetical protein